MAGERGIDGSEHNERRLRHLQYDRTARPLDCLPARLRGGLLKGALKRQSLMKKPIICQDRLGTNQRNIAQKAAFSAGGELYSDQCRVDPPRLAHSRPAPEPATTAEALRFRHYCSGQRVSKRFDADLGR